MFFFLLKDGQKDKWKLNYPEYYASSVIKIP